MLDRTGNRSLWKMPPKVNHGSPQTDPLPLYGKPKKAARPHAELGPGLWEETDALEIL